MYLKSIEISGFKSFAKKSELVFGTPISAIVGPNGSGKSNVAEAFRFVLGEQSMKSLRGKKGEDLIFNGASDGARANRASVKVVFDNSRKLFSDIEFDEVSVERVVHRDGVNEYLLNGSQVRLKDIIELLASAHIGSSGHHIISQGEADRILSSSPRERRSMIEDSLGLKLYEYKREESERKLTKTEENSREVDLLRKEIAPHLRFLKKQVEKIEKAAEQRNELVKLAKEYLKREKLFIDASKKEIDEKRVPLLARKESLKVELDEARSVLASSKKDTKRDEVIAKEVQVHDTRSTKNGVLEALGAVKGEIVAEERALKLQKDIVASEVSKTVPLVEIELFSHTLFKKISEVENLQDVFKIKDALREIKELFQSFVSERKTSTDTSQIELTEKRVRELDEKKSKLEKELSTLVELETKLESESKALQASIEQEKDSNRDAEKSLFRIMSEEKSVHSELHFLEEKSEHVRYLEEEFKRQREECALLAGRGVLDYDALDLPQESERELQEERKREIEKIKIRLEEAGLTGSADVQKEYLEVSERDAFLSRELEDLTKSSETLKRLIKELGEKLDSEFKEGIQKINNEFGTYFSSMFGGGTAKLVIVKEKKRVSKDDDYAGILEGAIDEEVEEGIDIEVSLPRKKIKGLMMLSGGERALTSIALLFAMSQVKPPPFIILDETDAALDEANSRKYGDMIESLARYSQLILITHNRETMSRAGVIYGVTMGSGGVSKILSIMFDEAVAVAK